jgi:hypothetical protein
MQKDGKFFKELISCFPLYNTGCKEKNIKGDIRQQDDFKRLSDTTPTAHKTRKLEEDT